MFNRMYTLRILFRKYSLHKQMVNSLTYSTGKPIQMAPSQAHFSSFENNTSSEGNQDILAGQLRKANMPQLLELIEMHSSVMNNQHLIHAMNSLFLFKKDGILPNMFLETMHFKNVSRRLQRRAQFFEASDVINILKMLSFLGVPSSSDLMQTYFQMLRHQINELSLRQYLYVDFLLQKQASTPLTEALKIALPIVMENHLDLELDKDNLKELVSLFEFGVKNNMTFKYLRCISEAIIQYPKNIPLMLACNILWSCIKLKKNQESFSDLFNRVLEVLVSSNHLVPPEQLVSLIASFNKKHIFCSTMVKDTCRRAVIERWPFPLLKTLLISTTFHEIYNTELLDYYCESIIANETEVKEGSKVSILSLVEAFAKANYIPRKSADMLEIIMSYEDKMFEMFESYPQLYLKFCLSLAVLDWYHPKVLGRVCNEAFTDRIFKLLEHKRSTEVKNNILKSMLLLSQIVNIHGYMMNLPEHMKVAAMKVMQEEKQEFPLQSILRKALGGEQYVKSGLFTQSGLFIDHYIALRQGAFPIALCNEHQSDDSKTLQKLQFVEDITIPADSCRIAVIVHGSISDNCDNDKISGIACLPLKLLSQEGFQVVEILLSSWDAMHDHEKIPYLMNQISNPESRKMHQL